MPYKTIEQNRAFQAKKREQFKEFILNDKKKRGNKCEYCGYDDCIEALQYHHRIPEEKGFQINRRAATRSIVSLQKELDKCDLICSNCHIKEHKDDWYAGVNQFS